MKCQPSLDLASDDLEVKQEKSEVCISTFEGRRRCDLTVEDHVQNLMFGREIQALKTDHRVPNSSSVRSLAPFLDENKILFVGGRLQGVDFEYNKHPYLISHESPVVEKIVRDYHEKAHLGTEWLLSLIREKFWITRARSIIKSVGRRCVVCKKLYGKTGQQLMSSLPSERLEVRLSPFSNVGLDCFGPFYFKLGRSQVKRYVCIFTCIFRTTELIL